MANRQRQAVRYRKFKPQSRQPEGLLAVAREGGDLERRVASGYVRLAGQLGRFADRQAAIEGEQAGIRDALAGRPEAGTVTGGSAPRGIVVGEKDANETAAAARDYLIERHGLQPHQAAALAGHGMQESSFNLSAVGDNGTAFGVFQWRGNRLTNLKRFAKRTGRNWQQLDTQLDFTMHELATSESYAGKALKSATNLDEAVTAFMHFERPRHYTRANPAAGHGFANRLAFARGLSGVVGDEAARSSPLSATPIGEAVPVNVAAPGTFRPTGSATIRGRAYDVAGTRTYLQQLDLTMQQDMANVYDAYNEDPAMLEKALGELEQAHLKDHVFDEIAGDYSAQFGRKSQRMVERSREAFEVRQEQAEREKFLGRIDELEEEKSRFLAGQNAGAGRDAEDLFGIQSSIDAHFDDAVVRGVMSAEDAERYKKSSMRSTAVSFHLGQADGKTAVEISEMRKQIATDYSDGKLDNVDRESFADIDQGLAKLAKDRETAEGEAIEDLRREGDDLAQRIVAGETIPVHEVTNFQRLAEAAPDGNVISQSALRRMRVAHALKTNPIAVVRQHLEDLVKRPDGTVDTDDLAFARKLIEGQEKALETDPLNLAERYGSVPVVSGILDDMQAVGSIPAVQERIDTAHAVSKHFGIKPKYFTGDEPAKVAELIRSDPEAGLALVAGIVEAGGDVSGDMLRELRDTAPEAEWAGVVFALGGSARAAQDALLGNQPGPDGKQLPNAVKKSQRVITGEVMGGSLSQLHPEDRTRIEKSAMSIARRRAVQAGVDPDSREAEAIFRRSLNEAAGAVAGIDGQRGGFGEINGEQVLLPPGMSADGVEDLLEGMTDEDLEALGAPLSPLAGFGVKVTADDIADGILLAVAPGVYRVAKEKGGRLDFIGDPAGGFWELDLKRLAQIQNVRAGLGFKMKDSF
ncbi:phage tail tip lysozyme [Roseibium album]|uniref:phage tail tip lysozyme n=1 Tax=Roseibium album TaxID=311410 RepID=UPI002492EFC7|nr:phage tail tip lysozyme [Roseibium album]